MNQLPKQSKVDPEEASSSNSEQSESYYYDDATNYETYCEDDEDENESLSENNCED